MRGFLFWFFSCVAGAFRGIENVARQVQAYVQEQEQRIVYKQFEAAMCAWEKRTGRVVERDFKGDECEGKDWKNFAAFLGGREAHGWRTEYGYSLEKAIEEWRRLKVPEPEMYIEGEEEQIKNRSEDETQERTNES